MFLMDRFFNGAFLTFGLEVIAFAERDQEDRLDPMIYIFPRMTKCTFHKFGTSGEVRALLWCGTLSNSVNCQLKFTFLFEKPASPSRWRSMTPSASYL